MRPPSESWGSLVLLKRRSPSLAGSGALAGPSLAGRADRIGGEGMADDGSGVERVRATAEAPPSSPPSKRNELAELAKVVKPWSPPPPPSKRAFAEDSDRPDRGRQRARCYAATASAGT